MDHNHNDLYYTKADVDNQFYTFEQVNGIVQQIIADLLSTGEFLMEHIHDERYFTKDEVTELIAPDGTEVPDMVATNYYTKIEMHDRFYTKEDIDNVIEQINDSLLALDQKISSAKIAVIEGEPILLASTEVPVLIVEYDIPYQEEMTIELKVSALITDVSGTVLTTNFYNGATLIASEKTNLSSSDIGKSLSISKVVTLTGTGSASKIITQMAATPVGHTVTLKNRSLEVTRMPNIETIKDIVSCDSLGATGGTGSGVNIIEPLVCKCYNESQYPPCTNPTWTIDKRCARYHDETVKTLFGARCPVCDRYDARTLIYYENAAQNRIILTCHEYNCQQAPWELNADTFWTNFKANNVRCPLCSSHFIDVKIEYKETQSIYKYTGVNPSDTWVILHNLNTDVIVEYETDNGELATEIQYLNNNSLQIGFASPQTGTAKCIVAEVSEPITMPLTTWEITHNLNSICLIYSCMDENGQIVEPNTKPVITDTIITLNFNQPINGYCFVSKQYGPLYGKDFGVNSLISCAKSNITTYTGSSGGTGHSAIQITRADGSVINSKFVRDGWIDNMYAEGSHYPPKIPLGNPSVIFDDLFLNSSATGMTGGHGPRPVNMSDYPYAQDFDSPPGTIFYTYTPRFTGGVGGPGKLFNIDYSHIATTVPESNYFYEEEITALSPNWIITHNFNATKMPDFICFNEFGQQLYMTSATKVSDNVISIMFAQPHIGKIYLIKGQVRNPDFISGVLRTVGEENYIPDPWIIYCPDCERTCQKKFEGSEAERYRVRGGCPICGSMNFIMIYNMYYTPTSQFIDLVSDNRVYQKFNSCSRSWYLSKDDFFTNYAWKDLVCDCGAIEISNQIMYSDNIAVEWGASYSYNQPLNQVTNCSLYYR